MGIPSICRGTLHKPVVTSLVPFNITSSSLVTTMFCWLKLASHPESHNFPLDVREICANPGSMCASLASLIKVENYSLQPLVECRIWPFVFFLLSVLLAVMQAHGVPPLLCSVLTPKMGIIFTVVMVIYHNIERIWRIIVTPNFLYDIYNHE